MSLFQTLFGFDGRIARLPPFLLGPAGEHFERRSLASMATVRAGAARRSEALC